MGAGFLLIFLVVVGWVCFLPMYLEARRPERNYFYCERNGADS